MTRWLDDDEQRAWRSYVQMQARLNAHLGRQLQRDSGLSLADYGVLVQLTEVPEGRLRPFALQERLEWEQSRLSHHLSRMSRRGLVERQECPSDARGAFVAITAAGRAALEAAAPGHVATVRDLFLDQLDRDELRTLERFADRVLRRLAADPAE
ncbi:MarR family winged helix-turn-helix transcriptional regulator [Micromonospora cathayae]|uniref:MarR family winged helix-turn-helix transcriptional regulator n=1 Tax=Micromonospora cathayae TaxID=3028804 RepID=A0ABY7ZK62_9ACTN|nr:MarR family winged helix-turn-helix transcriptional regulator [Micromonospora sp. HUAS 3]WDZ83263.1 MarR family winged helix-turn-helix transcriptional regulator [Micromonospora sp. HUAS 3]